MIGDLHIHSNLSDGSLSTDELLTLIAAKHVTNTKLISITDHNYLAFESIQRYHNLLVVPGIEISATEHSVNVHLTAYFSEVKDRKPLDKLLDTIEDGYNNRARKQYQKIIASGYKMPPINQLRDRLLPGHIYTNDIINGFKRANGDDVLLRAKKDRLFYVDEENFLPTITDAINVVHNMNGLAFWAHPGTMLLQDNTIESVAKYMQILDFLVSSGIDGIEVYYYRHTSAQTDILLKDAKERNLLISGGSDFHAVDGDVKSPHFSLEDKYCVSILDKLGVD